MILLEIFPDVDGPHDQLFEPHDISNERLSLELDVLLHVLLLLRVQSPDERSYLRYNRHERIF